MRLAGALGKGFVSSVASRQHSVHCPAPVSRALKASSFRSCSSSSSSSSLLSTKQQPSWTYRHHLSHHLSQRGFSTGPDMAAGAGPTASATAAPGAETFDGLPKLVIFGGNGFVGSRVSQEAAKTGLQVVSISRSGAPPRGVSGNWVSSVQWTKGDVFDPSTWKSQLDGAVGVISTLGAFGGNDYMYRICGKANEDVFQAAKAAGVSRAVFISVHDYGTPGFFLPGYFNGKRAAEKTLAALYPDGGVALRPGFIYGSRNVAGIGIPLQAVGYPLEKVLSVIPTKSLAGVPLVGAAVVPPVSATAVAKAAVTAATDPTVPAGIMDVWDIAKYT